MIDNKVAFVTGASRGLGFAIANELSDKGYIVVRGIRNEHMSRFTINRNDGCIIHCDVTNSLNVYQVAAYIEKNYGRCDILINNAGIMEFSGYDNEKTDSILKSGKDNIIKHIETNALGALCVIQHVIPLMLKNNYGRIVNVSSILGSITETTGGYAAYRISKCMMNMVTKLVAEEIQNNDVIITSVCPGWTKTDMGGLNAEREPSESAKEIIWAAELPKGFVSGGFYQKYLKVSW